MNIQETVKKVYNTITGEDILVEVIAKNKSCTMFFNKRELKGIITKLNPTRLVFSLKVEDIPDMDILPYLKEEQAKVWAKYHPNLFSIVHEAGHAKTLKGLNFTEYRMILKELIGGTYDLEEANRLYRQTTIEQHADNWAYEWVTNHPQTASYCNDMLYNMRD
jgi:hypothetical protein